MKRQSLLSWKSKKIIVNLSFAEFAYSVLSVKEKKAGINVFLLFFCVFFHRIVSFLFIIYAYVKYP